MPFFDLTMEALASGRRVHVAMLADLDFSDGMVYLWDGVGNIVVGSNTYQGAGELVSISEIEFGANDSADKMTLTLSGVSNDFIAAALNAGSVRGRTISLYGQFLAENNMAPIDSRWLIRKMIMDTLSYNASGPTQRSISLTCETVWSERNHAAYAYHTVKDQDIRFPGDVGHEFVPTLKNKKVAWPIYPGG